MNFPRTIAALGAAALLAVGAGCGGDSSGSGSPAAPISIPPPTSPLDTTATAVTPKAGGKGKAKTTETATAPAATACEVPDTFQDFKFSGIDCPTALGIATAWDQNGKDCNTIDNPDSPEGYNRTCSVEDFACTAKRDVHSDGRFVTCTKGGASIRFTWFPA